MECQNVNDALSNALTILSNNYSDDMHEQVCVQAMHSSIYYMNFV